MCLKLTHTLLLCIILILVSASVITHVIALATNFWLTSSDAQQSNFLNIGLFVACFNNYLHMHDSPPKKYDGCHDLYSDTYATIQDWLIPSWLVTCKIIGIIALIMQIISIILLLLLVLWWCCKSMCGDDYRDCCERCLIYTVPILFILAGVFIMTVVMIFADNAFRLQCRDFWLGGNPNDNRLGWSWGFELASCILSLISGGFLIWLVVLKARDDF